MDFTICTLFPEKINKEINKLKRDIAKLGPKNELNWPPYLTLRNDFDVPGDRINDLIKGFNKFKKNIRPIQIKIDGFEFIENVSKDPWIKSDFLVSIKVIKSKELETLNLKLNEFKLFSTISKGAYIPRIILAKDDLDKASFERVKAYLKNKKINLSICMNNITFILNKNDNHIIYKKLRLE